MLFLFFATLLFLINVYLYISIIRSIYENNLGWHGGDYCFEQAVLVVNQAV